MKSILLITFALISCSVFGQNEQPSKQENTPVPSPTKTKPAETSKTGDLTNYNDDPAEFPGGIAALHAFIRKNQIFPPSALEKGINGKCYVQFTVTESGAVSDIKVVRSVTDCPECDEEAVRVLRLMPKWKPGRLEGNPVPTQLTLPVTFQHGEEPTPKQ